MIRKLLFLALFLSFLSGNAVLVAQAAQYDNQLIEELTIIVEGDDCADNSSKAIASRLTTREKDFFSHTAFDSDLKLLARDYDNVEPTLESIDGKMHITLKVWPKPVISAISWSGNKHITTAALQKELGIKSLSAFDRMTFNKAFHKVKTYYVRKGYFEAELDYTVIPSECGKQVDIAISIKEGRAGHINQIIFRGFTKCEEQELLELVHTKRYNFLLSWYTNEGIYHEDVIRQDQYIVLSYLQNLGYADAKVDINVEETKNNRINIFITAYKGEIYRVGNIDVTGNVVMSNRDIAQRFTFGKGSPYSAEEIRATISAITNLYGRRGYIDATVDFEPFLDVDTLTYSIKLTIEEGEQYRVGLIKVFGNCTTQTNIILHESLLVPGEVFNIEKLKLTEEKLVNVGYFESVNVYYVKSDGPLGLGESYRDVHIDVKETSTGNFGAFFGYSSSESLFGGINITERNFNYAGIGSVWSQGLRVLRGGGEYAHATFQVGLKSRKYILSWAKPFFRDTQWTVGFDLERSNNRYISDDYSITSDGVTLHATYRINQFVHFGWHYRLSNSHVTLEKHKHNRELKHDADEAGLISGSGISLSYDSTDHPTIPRKGFRSRLDLEYVGLGGDHTYFTMGYINSYFLPLGKKNIIRYRADFRFIIPVGHTKPHSVPINERLFLGGETMVRGFRSYRLGPLFHHTDDPSGGISEQFYSIEIARRMHDRVEAFTFLDAGYLSLHRFKFDVPYTAVGVGARVKIMEGFPSVTLGYGVPVNRRVHHSQVKKFFISLGGKF